MKKYFYLKSQPHLVRAIGLCFSWLCLQIFQGGFQVHFNDLLQFTKKKFVARCGHRPSQNNAECP